MPSTEMRSPKRYRSVSDLRTQYLCEYRLYLKNIHGDQDSEWTSRGNMLHSLATSSESEKKSSMPFLKAILLIVIVMSAVVWILG